MNYQVQVVADHELPEGVDLVIVERGPHERPVMLLSGRPAEAWAAMRAYGDAVEPRYVPSLLHAV